MYYQRGRGDASHNLATITAGGNRDQLPRHSGRMIGSTHMALAKKFQNFFIFWKTWTTYRTNHIFHPTHGAFDVTTPCRRL